ncbi:hypothetical protein ASG40_16965 [Methylobacterium sp. Leaf399]|uniref:hypothetical protein n=1 Tax=Methylobacterium sp. Leaf399 TaxID=1736364 RepID=UPI0006F5162E|nr:hypothetical protein [Methylobacterium sp. Leaf399]KQT17712.1 hypothetical protein ASG40_16965 [Methylobacterium sp. Leaf399]
MVEDFAYDVPSAASLDRLIRWHEKRAAEDGRLALNLDADDLPVAAETNRQRSSAHRQTAVCLKALRERHCPPDAEFRGHLNLKPRPKAQIRAPP